MARRDPLAQVLDALPLRPRRAAARGGAPAADEGPAAVSAIEPQVSQLIGALVLERSLRRSAVPPRYRLCLVDRATPEVSEVLEACGELGVDAAAVPPKHENPFLNKWLPLDAFPDLERNPHVALLDWDLLLCTGRPLPGPFGSAVAARRNPSGMYRDLLGGGGWRRPLPRGVLRGRLRSSVNGGVMIGSGASLRRCAAAHDAWFAELSRRAPETRLWKVDQLAQSLAVGEVGLAELEPRWNVTPQPRSRIPDRDVCLWHYNDGIEASRLLKRCLHEPARAEEQLSVLEAGWPSAVALFRELFDDVLALEPVARLLPRAEPAG